MTYKYSEQQHDNIKRHCKCFSNNNSQIDEKSIELLFLYVDDYKIFKNIPINCNAKYDFTFNKDENELNISVNSKFENILPQNTNLKIFCGKNGTGKSTLIEILNNIDNIRSKRCFVVLKDKNNKFITTKNGLKIIFNNKLYECKQQIDEYFSISSLAICSNAVNEFDYSIDNNLVNNYINNRNIYDSVLETELFDHFEIRFFNFRENIQNIFDTFTKCVDFDTKDVYPEDLYKYFMTNPLQYMIYKIANEEFYEHFKPEQFLDVSITSSSIESYFNDMFNNFCKEIGLTNKHKNSLQDRLIKNIYDFSIFTYNNETYSEDDYENKDYIYKEHNLDYNTYNEIIEFLKDIIEEFYKLTKEQEYFNMVFPYNSYLKFFYMKPYKLKNEKRIYPEKYSEGEFTKIKIITDLLTMLSSEDSSKSIILDDEIDAHMHPKWIKDYLFEYLSIINKYNQLSMQNGEETKILNIIFTTHSPFIMSDVTNDYIEYLDKNGDYAIIKNKNNIKNTFAANILQMFEDNFFLDSTMGKYSKKILQEIITFLSREENNNPIILLPTLNKDQKLEISEKIIASVGDDILKKMLVEKLERFKNSAEN